MKKGLTAGLLIALGFVAGAAVAVGVVLFRWWSPGGPRFDLSQPAVVHQVRQLHRLETVVFAMDKVISGGYESRYLPRFVAGDRLLLMVYGDVTAGVDLGRVEAAAVNVNTKGRAVTLRLPPPEVFATRLDNERTRVYSRETGLFTPVDPGLESEVRREAERQIRQAALEGGILRTATLNASTTLKSFLQGLGFERVEIGESPPLPVGSMAESSVPSPRDAHGKALSLNLDASMYGTLAEIGAGQEVARWFLSVGAASGTVAKTISAYDKRVSDEIYGAGTRYVSKERLLAMLDHEYGLVRDRLRQIRGETTRFFVFADTVAVRNYQGTNEPHGWMGIRFQHEPGAEPSQILLHINLSDPTAPLQQQVAGILGVNLVYGAFHQSRAADTFLEGLFDGLSAERVEVDVIDLEGPAFVGQETRLWCLELVQRGMAHAIVFDTNARVVEPSSLLRKRPLLVVRGSFSHPEHFAPSLFEAARRQLEREGLSASREPAALQGLTVQHAARVESQDVAAMLACIKGLAPSGAVVVTDFPETYWLSRYLRRHSTEPVRFILSAAAIAMTLHEAFYQDLPGQLLEGIGRLLAANVKLYVAPMERAAFDAALGTMSGKIELRNSAGDLITLDELMPSPPGRHLLDYLRAAGKIVPI